MVKKPTHVKPALYAKYYFYLKEIAEKFGYNLLVHGSMNRDLDLVAIPWTEEATEPDPMIEELAKFLGARILDQSYQNRNCFPHGRMSYIINLNRGGKWNEYKDKQYYLDISVMPRAINNN